MGVTIDTLHVITPVCSLDDCRGTADIFWRHSLAGTASNIFLFLRGLNVSGFVAVDLVVTDDLAAGAYRSQTLLTSNDLSIGRDQIDIRTIRRCTILELFRPGSYVSLN